MHAELLSLLPISSTHPLFLVALGLFLLTHGIRHLAVSLLLCAASCFALSENKDRADRALWLADVLLEHRGFRFGRKDEE